MTFEFQNIGNATLYCGDCMEILPSLGMCADLLVTDPPYTLASGGGNPIEGRRMSGKFNPKNYVNDGNIVSCDIDWPDFIPLMYKSLKENTHAYIMCNNRHIKNMITSADDAGFKFHNLLVWDKGNATPNRWYMKNCEFTGFFYKGKAKFINDCGARQLLYIPQEPYKDHPTPKPVMLMKHYIEQSSSPEDTVIDPFMGVGSTGVAAKLSNRKFIGIELDKKYFDIACKRIENSEQHADLFLTT